MKDLHNNLHIVSAIAPQSPTGATAIVSAIIDRQGYSAVEFAIVLGAMTAAAIAATVLVEDGEASNLSDAAAVADENLLGTEVLAGFTHADDGECRKIGYIGPKRYVRMTVTPTSNDAAMPIAAIAILKPNHAPSANPPQ